MVRTKGPLLSLSAQGSIGKILTATEWKNRQLMKKRTAGRNPRSPLQVSCRSALSFLAKNWSTRGSFYEDDWAAYGATIGLDAYEAYRKYNLDRWSMYAAPTALYPANHTYQPGGLFMWSADVALRTVLLGLVLLTQNRNWAMYWFRSQVDGFTPGRETFIYGNLAILRFKYEFRDGPLEPGTYYYRCLPIGLGGAFGSFATQQTVVIPG